MSRANELNHLAKHLDVREVCEYRTNYLTYDKVPIRKILIANISPETPHKLLRNTFAKFGVIIDCIMKKRKKIPEKKNYAFITYKTPEEAQRAVNAGYERKISIKKQYLRVVPANSWNQPDNPLRYKKVPKKSADTDEIANKEDDNIDQILLNRKTFSCESRPINLGRFNHDCLIRIFNFLPLFDRLRAEEVCQFWKMASKDAWRDFRKLDLEPESWGLKSVPSNELITRNSEHPDACSVYNILNKCAPYLTHVDFSKNSAQLGDGILIQLAKHCFDMKSLNLRNYQYSHAGIKALASTCVHLESIKLGYVNHDYKFDNELIVLFARNQKLRHVDISSYIIEGNCFKHLPKNTMEELILRNADYVLRNSSFKVFERLLNLRVIRITNIPADFKELDDIIKCIAKCSKLEVIEISTKFDYEDHNLHNKNILLPLFKLMNLTSINFKGSRLIDDEFLILLTDHFRNLKSLNISDCPLVTDAGLHSITSLPKLEYLCIDNLTKITDIPFAKRMPYLKILLCSGCINIQPLGLYPLLESAINLTVLDLTNCSNIDNFFIIYVIRRCKRIMYKRRTCSCLKLYLKGTSTILRYVDLDFHNKLVQLLDTERPVDDAPQF